MYQSLSKQHKNIVNLPVKLMSFPQAMRLARKHNINIEFPLKAVCATKLGVSILCKYSDFKDQDTAAVAAIEECIERFNQLTKAH